MNPLQQQCRAQSIPAGGYLARTAKITADVLTLRDRLIRFRSQLGISPLAPEVGPASTPESFPHALSLTEEALSECHATLTAIEEAF